MLNELVSRFEERVEILLRACDAIDVAFGVIEIVEYERQKFRCAVENVQKVVDSLSLAGFSNLASWVDKINSRMGILLANRLQDSLRDWSEAFNSTTSNKKEKPLRIPKISVEILLRNQEISAIPAVSSTAKEHYGHG